MMRNGFLAAVTAVAVGLTLCAGHPTLAAAPGAAKAKAGGRMAKMSQELNLTPAQKAQMKPILQSTRKQMMVVRANTSLSPEAKKTQMMAIRKNMMAQIAPILTPAQKATLKQQRMERKGK